MISLLGLMVAGAVVRVAGLSAFYLSPDEATIMAIARQPTLAAVFHGTLVQAHPPFHFFLMHFWPDQGNSIMWLRVTSFIPGLLFIPACYLLGKKAVGPAAAWLMAILAAFGTAPMTLAEVIRPYALVGLLLAAGLWFWFDFVERPRIKSAIGYGAFMVAALAFHYSSGLFIAGAGMAGAAWLLARRRPLTELMIFCAAHLPAAGAGAALYYFHLSRIPELQRSWMEGYLRIGFPQSPRDLLHHCNTVLFYFFLEPLAPVFAILCVFGLVALILRRRYPALLLIGSCFAVTLALNLAGVYPLYGLRHSYWLFLPVALLCSAALELLRKPDPTAAALPAPAVSRIVPLIVIPLAAILTGVYGHYSYLRLTFPTREAEFALRKDFFYETLAWFDHKSKPGDLILTTLQTADLLRFVAAPGADRKISPNLSRLGLNGRDYVYAPEIWTYKDRKQLGDTLREALAAHATPPGASVFILSLGYGAKGVSVSTNSLFLGQLVSAERTTADYLFIVRAPVEDVRRALER